MPCCGLARPILQGHPPLPWTHTPPPFPAPHTSRSCRHPPRVCRRRAPRGADPRRRSGPPQGGAQGCGGGAWRGRRCPLLGARQPSKSCMAVVVMAFVLAGGSPPSRCARFHPGGPHSDCRTAAGLPPSLQPLAVAPWLLEPGRRMRSMRVLAPPWGPRRRPLPRMLCSKFTSQVGALS